MREYGIEYTNINKEKAKDKNLEVKSDRDGFKVSEEKNIKEMTIIDDSRDLKFKDNDIDNKLTHSTSEEKKETKWDKIDWSKDTTERKKETKWDKIDWSKDYSSEEKKIEGYKNDSIDDNMMTGEDYKEKMEDIDFNEEEIDNKDDYLSWLKDYEENSEDNKLDDLSWLKDYNENSEDNKLDDLSWLKDYDENSEDKVFSEGLEKKQEDLETSKKNLEQKFDDDNEDISSVESLDDEFSDNDFDKNFVEGIDDELEHSDIVKDLMEVESLELKNSEVKDMMCDQQTVNEIDEIKERNYENLLNEGLQEKFKEYHELTGKFVNIGPYIGKDFIHKLDNEISKRHITEGERESLKEFKQRCEEINRNQEIRRFVADKIKNTSLNQTEISNESKKLGFYISRRYVAKVSLENIYNGNREVHEQRFSKEIPAQIKEKILERLENEVKKENPDSLYKIQKDFPNISKKYIDNLARETIPREIYKNVWPSTQTGSKEKITDILEQEGNKVNSKTLREIAKEANASATFVNNVAKEKFSDKYQELWPAIENIPEETKNKIFNTIKNEVQKENPRTLRDIHKDFPDVGSDTIKRLAKQTIPKELHDKIWQPLTTEIPKDTTLQIIKTLKREAGKNDASSLHDIAKKYNVSHEYTRKVARKEIPQEMYENTWKPFEPISDGKRNKIVNDIKNSNYNISEIADMHGVSGPTISNISRNTVFKDKPDTHRQRFPNDPNFEIGILNHKNINAILTNSFHESYNQKYYSEPNIYADKRRPDGLILENSNFLHDRLTDPKCGQYLSDTLKIDSNQLNRIKATQVDFTNDISEENIMNKIEKYQSKDTIFNIVGTKWHDYEQTRPLPDDARIKYPENIRVISHDLFADLIGLDGKNRALYNKNIEFNYDNDLNSLKVLYNYELSETSTHNTKELKQDLIQKNLINNSFDEFFDFEVSNNKDDKRKQRDLDYFLNS